METIFRFPGRAYDYISIQFGWVGLMVAGLLIVMAIVFFCIYFDRRR